MLKVKGLYILSLEELYGYNVIKFGRTNNAKRRLKEHKKYYGSNDLYMRYVIKFSGNITNKLLNKYEQEILDLTKPFQILEDDGQEYRKIDPGLMLSIIIYHLISKTQANFTVIQNVGDDDIIY